MPSEGVAGERLSFRFDRPLLFVTGWSEVVLDYFDPGVEKYSVGKFVVSMAGEAKTQESEVQIENSGSIVFG